jgi:periplasmic protein TonB
VVVSPLSLSSLSPSAPRARAGHGGRSLVGASLLASATLHVAVTFAATVLLSTNGRTPGPPPHVDVNVDVDVASVAGPTAQPPPSAAPVPSRTPSLRARRAAPRPVATPAAPPAAPAEPREDPRPPDTLSARPARFVMSAGTVVTQAPRLPAGTSPGASSPGANAAPAPGDDGSPVAEGDVSVPARVLASHPVVYPPAARQAEIEADLPVSILVGTDGRVLDARSLTRAGYGLDEAAESAIRGYRFTPALRDGRPVRVRMRWAVQFRLR